METLLFGAASFVLGLGFVPLAKNFGKKYRLYDIAQGDELKIHENPISYLGGIGMFLAIVAVLIVATIAEPSFTAKGLAIVSSAAIMLSLGLWDDMRWKHISKRRPVLKLVFVLAATFLAAFGLAIGGIGVHFFSVLFLAVFATFIYAFLSVNALNYQDGMDGLAGGFVAISSAGFFLVSVLMNNILAGILPAIVFGGVIAFLIFNLPPAKIFMGDSGAYMLGLLLVAMASPFIKQLDIVSMVGVTLIIGMPIVDGIFTNGRRVLSGKSIFLGDRSHFYDRLLQKGFSSWRTLAVSFAIQLIFVAGGIIILLQ